MRIRVVGGQPLNGTFTPSGNPNAAKALLAAALLTDQPVTLRRVPRNTSTQYLLDAAEQLGASLAWQGTSTLDIHTEALTRRTLDESLVSGAVGALLFLAPLIIRREVIRIEVDFPLNRIRTHLDALRDLGLGVVVTHGAVEIVSARWDSKDIILNSPSVTATAIAMMLAAVLGGRTVIYNAACEPHISDLAAMLNNMGASITGAGSNRVQIIGAETLRGTDETISYDHIEIASVAAIVALSGGRVQMMPEDDHTLPDLRNITRTFAHFGLNIDADSNVLLVPRHERFDVASREEELDAQIETSPYPGFPSDLITIAALIATQANGTSLLHERLFKDRLLFVDTLKDMGANIILADPHRAIVVGATPLRGTYIATPDPRFGLGILGAALIAHGESVIDNAERFDYTFDRILPGLQALGAQIHEIQA
ncbi:MAG: UDP-N-acetylglucosamine 1-carboxyvinyltransferase [Chloroflexota bacterium]